jgi:hypothetical protein
MLDVLAERTARLLMNARVQWLVIGAAVAIVMALAVTYLFLAEPGRDELCRAALGTAPRTISHYTAEAYQQETGRWLALTLYAGILPRFDPYGAGYGFALLGLFLLWFGGFVLAVDLISGGRARRRDRFLLALLLLGIFWCGAPSQEGINWLTGATEYGVPFFLMMLSLRLAACLDQPRWGLWAAIASGSSAILASGMHELAGLLLVGSFSCYLLVMRRLKRRGALFNAMILLLLCTFGFVVSAAAPGNFARAGRYTDGGNYFLALALTARPYAGPLSWLADLRLTALTLLLLSTPAFRKLRPAWTQVELPLAFLLPVGLLASLCVAYFLGCLVQAAGPGGRNLDFYYALFVVGWLASLVAIGAKLNLPAESGGYQQLARAAGTWLLALSLITSPGAAAALHDLPKSLTLWRQENGLLLKQIAAARARGEANLVVKPLFFVPRNLFDSGIRENPDFWSNRCMARFHRLRSIRLAPGAASGVPSGQDIVFHGGH